MFTKTVPSAKECDRKIGASACAFMIEEYGKGARNERALLLKIRDAGFQYVDLAFRETRLRETPFSPTINEADLHGLKVGCAALRLEGWGSAPNFSTYMDSARRPSIEEKIRDMGALGTSAVYMVPPKPPIKMEAFADFMKFLAGACQEEAIRFCIEPMPGTVLSNDRDNLRFVREASHPNLFVLIDNGHSLLAGEDPVESISAAGNNLGYIQVDDTNGKTHSHLPLYDGVLTRQQLALFMSKLVEVGYEGSVGIEIPGLENMTTARKELLNWTC